MSRLYIIVPHISVGAEDHLAAHGITVDEALDVVLGNPTGFRDKVEGRDMVIGKTTGGRLLTIVVEATGGLGEYDLVTGWDSSAGESAAWQRAK